MQNGTLENTGRNVPSGSKAYGLAIGHLLQIDKMHFLKFPLYFAGIPMAVGGLGAASGNEDIAW